MNATLRNSLAVFALAAATPAAAWTVYPDVDFEWYAGVGRYPLYASQAYPAPRTGYIWSPSHYEWTGTREVMVPGHWIVDDYDRQWRAHANGKGSILTTGPLELRDRDGNVIPIMADAYPVDSARK